MHGFSVTAGCSSRNGVLQDSGSESDGHSGSKSSRPVLQAKLSITPGDAVAPKANFVAAATSTGVTASAGGVRQQPGNAPAPAGGPPQLRGLPPNAQQSNITRLTGVTSGIVSRPKQLSPEAQFRQQLGSRALLREPVIRAATAATEQAQPVPSPKAG